MPDISPLYRFIVAHLAPGAVAFYPIAIVWEPARSLILTAISADVTFAQLFILLSIALVLGLVIDGIVWATYAPLIGIIREKVFGQGIANQKPKDLDDFRFTDQVYARNFVYKQFYGGLSFVATVTALIEFFGLGPFGRIHGIWPLMFAIAFVFASAKSWKNNEKLIEEYYRSR